nr:hypothetical protein [Deltaproteobacteria bacterium]
MKPTPLARAASLALLALAPSLSTGGCAEERPAINQVQPDYLDKADLIPAEYALLAAGGRPEAVTPEVLRREPVFYTQTTMIAKPASTGFVGLTSYSELQKVRWEVTERLLLARLSYDFVRGAPGGAGGIGQNPRTGEIVAAFAISSHFDIRRSYNESTGEELNVVVENDRDRPWHQRKFMRVDWSRNLVDGYNSVLQYERWEGRIRAEPVPVFVNSPTDPNAPVFEHATIGGQRALRYFDVVHRAILHPEEADLGPDLPNIPVCVLGDGETACNPAEVTFRTSFLRAERRDYEPVSLTPPIAGQAAPVPSLDQERFGFFDVSHVGFDRTRSAVLDTERVHLAARHNLWVHHHVPAYGADAGRDCNRDADCADGGLCRIGDAPRSATARGRCAAPGAAHLAGVTEPACRADADCAAVSPTAACDRATGTCGDRYVRCSADETCRALDPRSTCDLAVARTRSDNRGLCLLPFRQRQVRPIAYFESPNYPARMQPVTDAVVAEWNAAFADAVQSARRHECQLASGADPAVPVADDPCNAPAVLGTDPALGADAAHVFVGCHAPVWGSDRALPGYHDAAAVAAARAAGWDLPPCGPQGTQARLGDLRYHMIGSINDQDAQGYWGLANIAADPETGEIIAGRGAVWQNITDTYAAWLTDLVRLLNGDATTATIANGRNVIESMRQVGSGDTPSAQALDAPFRRAGGLASVSLASRDALDRLRLPGSGWLRPGPGARLRNDDPDAPGALDLAARRLAQGRLLGDGDNRAAARRASLRDTEIESALLQGPQVSLASTARQDPSAVLPATRDAASPLRAQDPSRRRVIQRMRARLTAWQCGHEAAFDDDVLAGLAQRIASGAPITPDDPADAPVAFGQRWVFRDGDGRVDYERVRDYAAQFIHHGVLAHEIGHSVGQRHNFTASADAVNYHDGYWASRGQGHPGGVRPRWEYLADPADGRYYSPEEVRGRVEEYAYSSVMDYKGLNEDAHGLGRYDRAFVKNGYVGMVEAFRRVADRPAALWYSANTAGSGLSTPLDLRAWSTGGAPRGMHYTQIPAIFGRRADGSPDVREDNRYDVFLRETRNESLPGWGEASFTNVTADGHVLVPYRFDSDERAGLVWQDQPNDAGADAYESMRYVSGRWLDYYFANSYSRLRSGFSTDAYVSRMWGRYVEQMRQSSQTLAFDLVSFQDFLGSAPDWRRFRDDPAFLGGFVNQAATGVVADAFVAMVLMPEMGAHRIVERYDGQRLATLNLETGAGFPVPINQGRGFESDWRNDAGFWWYEQLNRAGSYYDKVMALDAFTDPELLLLQRDTPADLRLFQLSFYSMYPAQTIRLWGGMLSEDYADFAPLVETGGTRSITRTHLATLNLPPGDGAGRSGRVVDDLHLPIDPQTGFTVQLRAAVMGAANIPATFDQRFMDFARVWTDGSVEALVVADPARDTVSFTDPWSRTTYRALHFGTGAGEPGADVGASATVHAATGAAADEAGIGARMILRLRDLDALRLRAREAGDAARAAALETQLRQYVDLVHVLRRLTARFGTGTSVTH